MAAQTQLYIYNQRQQIVLLSVDATIATRRYQAVYAKELTINRGVVNVLEFAFINQDQKPYNLLGKDFTFRIINEAGTRILLEKVLTRVLPLTGIFRLELTPEETLPIDSMLAYYSIVDQTGTTEQQTVIGQPAFVDARGGSRGILKIVDSAFPIQVSSVEMTIPTHPLPTEEPKTYYSSQLENRQNGLVTMIAYLERFTGNLQIQACNVSSFAGTEYNVGNVRHLVDYSGTLLLSPSTESTINGYHPFVRVKIENSGTQGAGEMGKSGGDIIKILAR